MGYEGLFDILCTTSGQRFVGFCAVRFISNGSLAHVFPLCAVQQQKGTASSGRHLATRNNEAFLCALMCFNEECALLTVCVCVCV